MNILQFFSIYHYYYLFIIFSLLFLPTTFTHTHTHDPRPLPTTHDPRHLATLYIKRVSVERVPMYPKPEKGTVLGPETPCIGHYRRYLLRGVTSRYLQSGNQQLEPIFTDGTCTG